MLFRLASACLLLPLLAACATLDVAPDPNRHLLAEEMESELMRKLDVWYPRVVDEQFGGYLTDFDHEWVPTASQNKMIVTQSRHLWTLSKVAQRFPERTEYAGFAAHGFEFLRDHMWDDQYGGFFQLVTQAGEPVPNPDGELRKTLYGNAFAIYGLAAYYGYSQEPAALALARRGFLWLEEHSHDKSHGGYFEPLARDGTPTTTGYAKDYNSGIHILEALAELYTVWPDPLLQQRLAEMFHIIRDTVTSERGFLKLYFTADWNHLTFRDSTEAVVRRNIDRDHVTPGHDIETAFLLLEAAHTLGMGDDPRTHHVAKLLADHTLENGWDSDVGGVYDTGYYFAGHDHLTVTLDTKSWWAQAEALHTLAIMAQLYPDDPQDYLGKLRQQWEYIKANLIDHEHGGWYSSGLDKNPQARTARKSHVWKGNYHSVRSLIGAVDQLRS
jgi:cellobiose epimerase